MGVLLDIEKVIYTVLTVLYSRLQYICVMENKYPWKQIWLQMSSLPVDNFGGILSTIYLLPCQGNYMIVCCYLSKIIEHILSIIIIICNCITYISEL